MGAKLDRSRKTIAFRLFSRNATRIEVWTYGRPTEAAETDRIPLARDPQGLWSVDVPLARFGPRATDAVYYGYRAWGPNWPFVAAWKPGTSIGFLCDVDERGNRFNPNKLLLDPYAVEISHDPEPRLSAIDPNEYAADYYTGAESRHVDTGRIAPKGVLPLVPCEVTTGDRPKRPLKDDVVYEVHLRGFTRSDPSIPEELRGTFRGAALEVDYLKKLGVTAVEFLPVFHFASEQNDDGDPRGDNYWGYMTLGYFAPNRRYSSDRTPGGPTRELRAMVKAFHDADIKVFLDVVYNHTGEGLLRRIGEADESRCADERQLPDTACLLSFRGLDNAVYYTLRSRPDLDGGRRNLRYQDNSACGPSLNVTEEAVQRLILDSLLHWAYENGVDGFRFDLAPVLANRLPAEGYAFDASSPDGLIQKIGRALPVRAAGAELGVDLIAEPWAVGEGTYQLGRFPAGWAQWNDRYRTIIRRAENKLHVSAVAPYQIADAVSGSEQQLRKGADSDARPWSSVNYVASHDGYTLRDVFSYTRGDESWDHGGAGARQRKAVRNAFALLATSAGVPMFAGGDELFRTQAGCENGVALDDPDMYLRWDGFAEYARAGRAGDVASLTRLRQRDDIRIYEFAREMLAFRSRHGCLRPDRYFTGADRWGTGLRDLAWYGADGREFRGDWADPGICLLGFRFDSSRDREATGVRSIYAAYNWNDAGANVALPPNLAGARWVRVADTAEWMEPMGNVDQEAVVIERDYWLNERSVVLFVEK